MGVNNGMVQGRGPQSMGAAVAFEVTDLSERTVPAVRVTWTVVRQYEVTLPQIEWERLGGAEGPAGGSYEAMLEDIEKLPGTDSDVIERNVDTAERVS